MPTSWPKARCTWKARPGNSVKTTRCAAPIWGFSSKFKVQSSKLKKNFELRTLNFEPFLKRRLVMPVKDWMNKDLVTIEEDTSIMKASKIMKQHNIQHLPVLRQGRLVSIVSDRDLKEATPSKATSLDIHEFCLLYTSDAADE